MIKLRVLAYVTYIIWTVRNGSETYTLNNKLPLTSCTNNPRKNGFLCVPVIYANQFNNSKSENIVYQKFINNKIKSYQFVINLFCGKLFLNEI